MAENLSKAAQKRRLSKDIPRSSHAETSHSASSDTLRLSALEGQKVLREQKKGLVARQRDIAHLFDQEHLPSDLSNRIEKLTPQATEAVQKYLDFTDPLLRQVSPSLHDGNNRLSRESVALLFDKHYISTSDEVLAVIGLYKDEEHSIMNSYTRKPESFDPHDRDLLEDRVKTLDTFLQQHSLPLSTIVVKDTSMKTRVRPYLKKEGNIGYFQDKAFVSTSLNPRYFHGEVMEELDKQDRTRFFMYAPNGTKGAFIDHPQLYNDNKGELEFLLPTSSTIKIQQYIKLDNSSFTDQDHAILSYLPIHLIYGIIQKQ